jgi:proline dehydrogenase
MSFDDTIIAFANKPNAELRKTYFIFAMMNRQWLVKVGTFFIKLSLYLHLPIKFLVKPTIFNVFCGGEDINDCQKTISLLGQSHIGTILDYSIEGGGNEAHFDATTQEIIRTIEKSKTTIDIPFCVFKITGIGDAELLEKVQNNYKLSDSECIAFERIEARTNQICEKANMLGVKVFIDAEESWIQESIDKLAYKMMEKYNLRTPVIYNTYQLYLKEGLAKLVHDTDIANEKGYFLGAKLVRGAYMEKERLKAHEGEYSEPVHATKADTDRDYNAAIDFCVRNLHTVSICVGTHNEYSCQHLVCQMRKIGLTNNDKHIWFAQLFGMSDNVSYKLAKEGYNVAKYVPYGPVESVMPYLFRRAEENTSVAGQAGREFSLLKKELSRRRIS